MEIVELVHRVRARDRFILTEPRETVFEKFEDHLNKGLGLSFVVFHKSSCERQVKRAQTGVLRWVVWIVGSVG
jgi:hypothetical protein